MLSIISSMYEEIIEDEIYSVDCIDIKTEDTNAIDSCDFKLLPEIIEQFLLLEKMSSFSGTIEQLCLNPDVAHN